MRASTVTARITLDIGTDSAGRSLSPSQHPLAWVTWAGSCICESRRLTLLLSSLSPTSIQAFRGPALAADRRDDNLVIRLNFRWAAAAQSESDPSTASLRALPSHPRPISFSQLCRFRQQESCITPDNDGLRLKHPRIKRSLAVRGRAGPLYREFAFFSPYSQVSCNRLHHTRLRQARRGIDLEDDYQRLTTVTITFYLRHLTYI